MNLSTSFREVPSSVEMSPILYNNGCYSINLAFVGMYGGQDFVFL